MPTERIESKLEQNTVDIGKLAVAMAELSVTTKNNERRHEETMSAVKEMSGTVGRLTEKISDIAGVKEGIIRMEEEIKNLKHTVGNLKSSQAALPEIVKDITSVKADAEKHLLETSTNLTTRIVKLETEVSAFKSLRDKIEGGLGMTKTLAVIFWTVFGTGLVGFGGFLLTQWLGGGSDANITE